MVLVHPTAGTRTGIFVRTPNKREAVELFIDTLDKLFVTVKL